MSLALSDTNEYAWLLVRSSLTQAIVETWEWVPIAPGSRIARLLGYPLRFLVLLVSLVVAVALSLALIIPIVQVPVTLFAAVDHFLPARWWLILLGVFGAILAGYLLVAVGVWLQQAARGDEPGPLAAGLADQVVAQSTEGGWNRWHSVHISHDSSRAALFGGLAVSLGVVLQCLAVVVGERSFSGPVDSTWQWPLLFGQHFFSTLFLGIPEGLLPPLSQIAPAHWTGNLLVAAINVAYASGAIALLVLTVVPAFKPRELFKGTVRDLADYLENFDITAGAKLMIHRVGVVRPLDEREVVSVSKAEFFAQLAKGS